MKGLIGALRIIWHEMTCPVSCSSTVRYSRAGRIYECPCGHGIWEVF